MSSVVHQQPISTIIPNGQDDERKMQEMKSDTPTVANRLPLRENFPKGLRGGGACFDCLACLCCCCAIEDIACFECCKEC